MALLLAALLGAGLFVRVEAARGHRLCSAWRCSRDPVLSAGLAMSALVSTVMMATLVVGPFYLSRALGLEAAVVGLVMSIGPLVAALAGMPAGRLVDRFGARPVIIIGLVGMAAGACVLSLMPARFGVAGYIAPLVVITAGYALFQAANNTAVMADIRPDQRGVVSGLLNLSRNLGLITGASAMGAVFALASATTDLTTAPPGGRRSRHADDLRLRGDADRACAGHRSRCPPAREGCGLSKLTVLAAPPIEAGEDGPAIAGRLALDAGPGAGKRLAATLRDRLAAFVAMRGTFTREQACARILHRVGDGIVDLLLNSTVTRPTAGHLFPASPSKTWTRDRNSGRSLQGV